MTNIMSRQQRRLIQRWFTPIEARRIAYSQQLNKWNIEKWTYNLTEQGKQYSALETRQRAIMRYAQSHWLSYNQVEFVDWKARKKKNKLRF